MISPHGSLWREFGIEMLGTSKRWAALEHFSFELLSFMARLIDMPHVDSSMMRTVEYDESTCELDITFAGGKTYRYFDVPSEIYAELIDSESKGEFFNENIKGAYDYAEVVARRGAKRSSS